MKKTLLAAAVASLFSHSHVSASDETMVVTANRFEQSKVNTVASVDVVTKEEISLMQVHSFTEVLQRLPGVQVVHNGGTGQASSVFLRGGSSKHVIVLIDGVRFGSSTLGYANYSSLPIASIDRVELIRGTRAAVYGADAVSGVINVITSTHPQETQGHVSAGVGSFGYHHTQASVAGSFSDNVWGKVGVNTEKADGYNISHQDSPTAQPDKDGYKKTDIIAEVGAQLSDRFQARVSAFYTESESDYEYYLSGPNSLKSPDTSEVELYNVATQLDYQSDSYHSSLIVALNRDENTNTGGEEPGSQIVTDRESVNWLNTFLLSETTTLQAGADYTKDSVADSQLWDSWASPAPTYKSYEKESRKNTAGYVSVVHAPALYQLEAAVRYDDNEQFGDFTTWQLGAGWNLSDQLRVITTAGTAFQAPTYNDLYWPDYGNPNLEPEESLSYEFGVVGFHELLDWQVVAYKTKIDNLIQYQGKGVDLENSDVEIVGVEIQVEFWTGDFIHNVSADFMDNDTKVKTSASGDPLVLENKELARRAKKNAKWNVSYLADNWQADLFYLYQGTRFDDTKNETVLDAYSVVDVSLNYFINDNVTLRGRIANLFDKEYQTAKGYDRPERSYYLSADYRF